MRSFSLTLRDKFLLAFLALALILTGMFILLASRISSMLPEMSSSQTERYEAQLTIRDMREAITNVSIPDSFPAMEAGTLVFREQLAQYQRDLSLTASPGAYQSLVFEDKHTLLDGEEAALGSMESALRDFESAQQRSDIESAKTAFRVMVSETEHLEQINSDATSALQASAAVTRRYLVTFSMIAVAILLLGILVMAQFLIAWISRPLEKIQHAAERIAEGDFNVELTSDSLDELGILTRSFDDMRRKVLKLNELRDGFIATASHQLRTPLTAIRWLLESLQKSVREGRIQLLQKDAQALEKAYGRTLSMSELVSSLLSLSRLDAQKMKATMTSVSLDDILSHVRSSMKEACDRKHVELRVSSDIIQPVRTDPLLVTEILTNAGTRNSAHKIQLCFFHLSGRTHHLKLSNRRGVKRVHFFYANTSHNGTNGKSSTGLTTVLAGNNKTLKRRSFLFHDTDLCPWFNFCFQLVWDHWII
jgi:signal transduction histidine kinase